MRTIVALLLGSALFVVAFNALADEKKADVKKTTLKGTIGCSKCEFGLTDDCGTAIKVKEGDKDVVLPRARRRQESEVSRRHLLGNQARQRYRRRRHEGQAEDDQAGERRRQV